ncbi:hypothetical protein [Lentilactobacillus kosonis]|uniref:Uncharacterized protein n=1 Tax=Lentilactobacillus kosonis TaxID=2810561 RepID=A0A401FML0_9LACO|nr:hypothetical protein [Lentilactobacillus kosonis]GAY73498.1 hypothetical protein NBRC111893_1644 [Lentilactobacillus kosonis]
MANEKTNQEIILDMDEFLITYAATILNPDDNVSRIVYDAAKDDLNQLDALFKDNGFGRTNKFYDIGMGHIRDINLDIADEELVKQADSLAKEAITYLGSHTDFFEKWRTD